MEDILVVVFDREAIAYEGLNYLNQLDSDGVVNLYAGAVIAKEGDGRVTTRGWQGNFPFHTIAGTAFGSLIGLLGGLAGFGIGATVGGVTGIIRDLHAADVNSHFASDVASVLKPGKFATIADVNEEYIAPIDTRMRALGGTVFRTEKQSFEYEVRMQQIAQTQAQIDRLRREEIMAMSGEKTKIQAQIDTLDHKLQKMMTEADQQAQQLKRETEAKLQSLEQKAAKAQGEAKKRINAQIDQLRQQYENSVAKLKNMEAEKPGEEVSNSRKAG